VTKQERSGGGSRAEETAGLHRNKLRDCCFEQTLSTGWRKRVLRAQNATQRRVARRPTSCRFVTRGPAGTSSRVLETQSSLQKLTEAGPARYTIPRLPEVGLPGSRMHTRFCSSTNLASRGHRTRARLGDCVCARAAVYTGGTCHNDKRSVFVKVPEILPTCPLGDWHSIDRHRSRWAD
jgi:hypothetical protein